jgi:hypothetical protein
MKRLLIFIVVGLLFTALASFADESVLIDFSKLGADTAIGGASASNENAATLIDFSTVAGASFTDTEKAAMKTSLALGNWEVVLASSSRTVGNQSLSFTKEATMKSTAKAFNGEDMASRKVLGIRVHFPTEKYNSWAIVAPPFDIPAYADKDQLQGDSLVVADEEKGLGRKFEEGYGIVKNVGILKAVSVTVYGSNFANGLGLIITNQDGTESVIFMDYLQFDGWKNLTWDNPNYITEVRNREIRRFPLYPKSEPYVKLAGIIIYRDATQEGGDFITYIKDVKVTYDKAVLSTERDINDEAIWGILQTRAEARRVAELKRVGNLQVLRYIERLKMDLGKAATAAPATAAPAETPAAPATP